MAQPILLFYKSATCNISHGISSYIQIADITVSHSGFQIIAESKLWKLKNKLTFEFQSDKNIPEVHKLINDFKLDSF